MPDRKRKRPNKANALARWDNEGGAAKGAPQKARDDMTSLAKEEEHILRCLGAAVIMQWDDLPTAIQRELFEHAISMGIWTTQLSLRARSLDSFTSIRGAIGSQVRLGSHRRHCSDSAARRHLSLPRRLKTIRVTTTNMSATNVEWTIVVRSGRR
jgi:hypothetical protein